MSTRDVRGYRRKANPDDPPVQRPPEGRNGPWPAPNFLGIEGRIAIVQGQVFILAMLLVAQLWLITDALYEFLSGRLTNLPWLAVASGGCFVIALVVTVWPRRRIKES